MWISSINQRIYYGWVVVSAVLVILSFATGLSFYNHAVILNALAQRPNFTIGSASLAVSLFFLSGGFSGLWVARLLDRFDARVCITAGAVFSATALCSLAYVADAWQLYCVYILFGMGFAGSALIPATTLITHWFRGKRAMALSIASTGLSLGGVIITPLSAAIVGKLGLDIGSPILGVIYLVGVVPITWLLLRPSPASVGIVPPARFAALPSSQPQTDNIGANNVDANNVDAADVDAADVEAKSNADTKDGIAASSIAASNVASTIIADGMSVQQALRSRFFWCFGVAYLFLMLAQVGGIAHQYGLARETLTESQTAMAVAIIPIASIVGRFFGGWMVDQVSMRVFAIGVMTMQIIALTILGFGSGVWVLCAGLALFGSTVGNLIMLQPLLVSEAFGVSNYARIFSLSGLLTSWGTAAGPWLMGLMYELSNNHYGTAYLVAALAGLLGLIFFFAGGKVNQ